MFKRERWPTGIEAWKSSIKFKMDNLRNILRRAGVAEAVANGGPKSKYQATSTYLRSAIQNAQRSEANYLPTAPENETAQFLKENVEIMKH